ncbi:formate--tetrahydrofolate ligase [candidate division WOR-1 bacterium RIFOXYA12_FULL_43_27]|uniref:Formate--tetrahydrofolate ligase n=1 Tax=candidate division WOR-1 bacterium RIFOXYC2_FULL_46_14 TaxID=1802587 RepID=A0A1F4U742_UNCSA|nr:MAG: formate--tetrahydrofolate ligase [candidate division WOR-1 bacterium RIFOXYA12_FULL_43_27]OGC19187.1 MAG: formate--tetrahydrofolate ligase [candidate division WOR-1 bacterium RIFOXYB2_FULL_46_45]OGC30176.1 MAG: formate--tetrahydrofolate ligase [candidate division WOR-1 bacterium RIFOXYA2_FULL_46_56]OGC40778.1 MAG: formate--tetrahydrofolate ligase [candidate division WOR-1 bacterium RIFOXYC2_FULL_46_14]
MPTDIQIAQKAKLKLITEIARKAGINISDIDLHGCYKAKVCIDVERKLKNKKDGKLILVTTMTPTRQGEGKTTTTIGLAQALKKIGKKAFVCIREPSLGPVMGMKGGAAGGGYSQVLPMDDINLHLTGDMHMVTSAHNLLAAMLHNHIFQGNELNIDESRIRWKRVMDMNDRSLRGTFDITASSEVMAILCLAKNVTDMKKRLGNIIIAYDKEGNPVRAGQIKAEGAMALLLWHAIKPNLVQTLEGGPAFVHGGPFANIAHGCNSLIATKLALKLSDYVVTEAGFGSDLGAEKFFDIKCRAGKLKPAAVVLVVTKQAIEMHGYDNVAKHVENIKLFGLPVVIAVNKKQNDTKQELEEIKNQCLKLNDRVVISSIWGEGGKGGLDLAKATVAACQTKSRFNFLYDLTLPLREKIETIAKNIYGADGVDFTDRALADLEILEKAGMGECPVCIAKTQYSLSDNPKLSGRPTGFRITVRELSPSAGAGFVVVYTGDVMTMPGLPKHPAAENMDITENGVITGLF